MRVRVRACVCMCVYARARACVGSIPPSLSCEFVPGELARRDTAKLQPGCSSGGCKTVEAVKDFNFLQLSKARPSSDDRKTNCRNFIRKFVVTSKKLRGFRCYYIYSACPASPAGMFRLSLSLSLSVVLPLSVFRVFRTMRVGTLILCDIKILLDFIYLRYI